ncbi:MAG: homoserine kinase [Acidobacteriota bacterium]
MSSSELARAFAPATVSNIACGFDILGFAVDGPGDRVTARWLDRPGVVIEGISGDGGRLPLAPDRNTAGVAARALLADPSVAEGAAGRGIGLTVEKQMPLSSGLGSSAASAVAAVRAVADLVGVEPSRRQMLGCVLEGERVACGSAHPDNAAPCVYGGFVLIRGGDTPDVVELPVPEGLSCAVVRPHVEIRTRDARVVLGDSIPLAAASRQWGNVGALVAALFRGDLELLSRSLVDHVAEPVRAPLVPGFAGAKAAALRHGALGCSLSGSGPSIFALAGTRGEAEGVADAMVAALADSDIDADRLVSAVGTAGARGID